jgi:transposase-like protein
MKKPTKRKAPAPSKSSVAAKKRRQIVKEILEEKLARSVAARRMGVSPMTIHNWIYKYARNYRVVNATDAVAERERPCSCW